MRWPTIGGRIGFVDMLSRCRIWLRPMAGWKRRSGFGRPTIRCGGRCLRGKSGDELVITDRHSHKISLAIADDRDATAAAEQLAELSSRGIKLRTRALTTTLFARLVLGDLFLHGIGGAKYDQVTDQIVRLFFGFEPPEFATVSATLRLPIAHEAADFSDAGQWQRRLRELRYHPEQFVRSEWRRIGGASSLRPSGAGWSMPKTPENAHERHRGIAAANEALQPFVAPLREQIERERDELQQRRRGEAILRSREYSFCLVSAAAF